MCTLNGERYLQKQLDSIIAQSHDNWTLFVSDDGSQDATNAILEKNQHNLGISRIRLFNGPNHGFARNFLSLLRRKDIEGPYFAFADQDDIWLPEKLEQALRTLKHHPQAGKSSLYCGRTMLIDHDGLPLGCSPLFSKPPSFRNALVQNIGGGNTMVFNSALRDLIRGTPNEQVISHDWWAYLLASATGGTISYDTEPTVLYRQHAKNQVGVNTGIASRLKRIRMMLEGRFSEWNEVHIEALSHFKDSIPDKNAVTLRLFSEARNSILPKRLYLLYRCGIYRQTFLGNLGLLVAALLRKL
jgi:glycosyltransferase involved in cell wall biosynthesis